jgi:ATP adenylyltransferase
VPDEESPVVSGVAAGSAGIEAGSAAGGGAGSGASLVDESDESDPPNRRFNQLVMRAMLQGGSERRASSLRRMERLWAPWRLEYVQHADEGDECIFCRAAALPEDEPELVIHRGERAFVLLNRFPYASGHLMVAPYRHGSAFDDLEDAEALETHRLAVDAIGALRAVFSPEGFNVGWNLGRVAGAGIVDHGHLHVVPRWNGDTNFMPVLADIKVIPEHLLETRRKLADAWPSP